MALRVLPPEVVSLIHHVELNRSGWWKKAVGQIISGLIWKLGKPVSPQQILEAFRAELGYHISLERVKTQLDALHQGGIVTPFADGLFKLTEHAKAEIETSLKQAEQEAKQSEDTFVVALTELCPTLDKRVVWGQFNDALTRAIRVIGANTFHLLADGRIERDVDWLASFLDQYPNEQEALRAVLARFFSPQNRSFRALILRLMSAYFFAEASQLPEATISSIEAKRGRRTLRIVLDTNFVFSLLGLHDNPADDAVVSLLDIVGTDNKFIDVKFLVLPQTIDEAQRSLVAKQAEVERVRVTRAVYSAVQRSSVSSIASKYFAAAKDNASLTAADYFRPYIEDLRTVLRDKGIGVLEAHPAVWNTDQRVIDDINDEIKREQTFPPDRRKGYQTLLHDLVLWHVVNERRTQKDASPLDVDWWVVSIDWRLIGFDQRKRAVDGADVPVVLYPTNLVQLLQFWLPRSEDLDISLVDTLRLPLFFHQFDPTDERATIKILEVLSRYENLNDLNEATIGSILANQALRSRIKEADTDNERVVELIREELVEENRRANQLLESTRQELVDTRGSAQALERSVAEEQAARRLEEAKTLRVAEELRSSSEATEATKLALQRQEALGEELRRTLEEERAAHERFRFIAIRLAGPAICIGLVAVMAVLALRQQWMSLTLAVQVFIVAALVILAVSLSVWWSARAVRASPNLQEWWLGKVVERADRWIVAPILGLVGLGCVGVYQGGAWDWAKTLLGLGP